MKNIKKALNFSGIIFFILITYLISQLIFEYRQSPKTLSSGALFIAKDLNTRANLQHTMFFMDIAAFMHIRDQKSQHPVKLPFNFTKGIRNINNTTKEEMQQYLTRSLKFTQAYNYNTLLARDYYYLSIIAYKNNYHELAKSMLSNAISIAPSFNYFHVELAKIYLINNQREEALDILISCQKFDKAKEHCHTFMNKELPAENYGEVGDFSSLVDKYLLIY